MSLLLADVYMGIFHVSTHELTEVTLKISMYTSANRSDLENTHVHIS